MSHERGRRHAQIGDERSTVAQPIGPATTTADLHHPAIARCGQRVYGPPEDREHPRHTVPIANQNYASAGPLHEPLDAARIHHGRPPSPPEVSGVVSSATGNAAHIRFVTESGYSGSAGPAVREVRETELAAAASAVGDQLRVAALTGLRELKDSLLAHCRQRETTSRELRSAAQQRRARAPAAGNPPATPPVDVADLDAASARVPDAFDRVAAQMWDECIPLLDIVRMAVGHRPAPPRITDYRTLAAQLSYIDGLRSTVALRMVRAGSRAGVATPAKPRP